MFRIGRRNIQYPLRKLFKGSYPCSNLVIGEKLGNYEVKEIFEVSAYSSNVVFLQNCKNGAKHYHFDNEEMNRTFSVSFMTIPQDHKGIPHILEHMMLCGSKKYPVNGDLFFMMNRRSLNTFLNAFTMNDSTSYLFSSANDKDFDNLLDVYLDSVYHSLLTHQDFCQEGWRIDLANRNDFKSEPVIKGVVFNEMKGYSTGEQSFFYEIMKNLHRNSIYGFNYGGEPLDIPNLKYEELLAFYNKFYSPANTKSFSYGKIKLGSLLDKLEEKMKGKTNIQQEIKLSDYNSRNNLNDEWKTLKYASQNEEFDQNHFSISWNIGNIEKMDFVDYYGISVLFNFLTESKSSPLYEAIIESGLAESFSSFTMNVGYIKEHSLILGFSGIESEEKALKIKVSTN